MSKEQGTQEGLEAGPKGGPKEGGGCSGKVVIGALVIWVLFAVGTGLAIGLTRPASSGPVRPYCDVVQCFSVSLAVKNSVQKPPFAFSLDLDSVPLSPLLPLMKRAAKIDRRFEFSIAYSVVGYTVTTINGLAANSAQNMTWQLTDGAGQPLSADISEFVPQDGETIHFTFEK